MTTSRPPAPTAQLQTAQHWRVRVHCDARLVSRKLRRRSRRGYALSGSGCQHSNDLRIVTLIAQIIAPTREQALSAVLLDLPGCVFTTCDPVSSDLPGGRLEGLLPWPAGRRLATPEQLQAAEEQIERSEARLAARRAWRKGEWIGGAGDAGTWQIDLQFPWIPVQPAYR